MSRSKRAGRGPKDKCEYAEIRVRVAEEWV